jgi:hypothetical protein
MPKIWNMEMDDATRARRHVVSQQMYRLRLRFRLLSDNGLVENATRVREKLWKLSEEYAALGGLPVHKGNIL